MSDKNCDVTLDLVSKPFRAIVLGLSTTHDACAMGSAQAREIAAALIVLADRLDSMGGASSELFELTEKPS